MDLHVHALPYSHFLQNVYVFELKLYLTMRPVHVLLKWHNKTISQEMEIHRPCKSPEAMPTGELKCI